MINYKTVDLKLFEVEIKQLFQKQPFGRYLSDKKIKQAAAIEFELDNLLNYSKQGVVILAVNGDSDVCGLIGFHFSEWDTNVFEKRMAFLKYFIVEETKTETERIVGSNLLDKFHDWVKQNNIQVVISKIDTQYFSPVYLLQQNGYVFYETITYQSLDVSSLRSEIRRDIKYRYASDNDIETLRTIALKSTFTKSHFYLDDMFPPNKVDLMYACWIENALKSMQRIVVIENSNSIAGAFIYEIVDLTRTLNKKIAVWKSAFVDSKYRDQGVGFNLFNATLDSCIKDGVDIIDSSLVEKNIVSQVFHNKLGFRLVNTQYTFHKWFDK